MDWKAVNNKYVKPAVEAWRAGRRQQAEDIFRAGLSATGNDGFLALNYAECLEEVDRYTEAADLYKLAIERLPLPKFQDRARQGLRRVTEKPQVTSPSPGISPFPGTRGRRIGLLSCTKDKKSYTCTARELYSESENFRRHLAFAEEHYDHIYVISAKHGLLELTQLLAPYEFALHDYYPKELDAWAHFIAARLRREGITANDTIHIHATEKYASPLTDALMEYQVRTKTSDWYASPSPAMLDENDGGS